MTYLRDKKKQSLKDISYTSTIGYMIFMFVYDFWRRFYELKCNLCDLSHGRQRLRIFVPLPAYVRFSIRISVFKSVYLQTLPNASQLFRAFPKGSKQVHTDSKTLEKVGKL